VVEIITTDLFDDWFKTLDQTDKDRVVHYLRLLEQTGATLDHPYTSAINGSRHGGGLRELRVQAKGRPLRVFYRFDRRRMAIVLCGADKQGLNETAFYTAAIAAADKAWDDWLEYGAKQFEPNED
jgi:hypothetical protein